MQIDTYLSTIITALKTAMPDLKYCDVGIDMASSFGMANCPAIFLFGGKYSWEPTYIKGVLKETAQTSFYIYVFDNNTVRGLAKLNSIRTKIIETLMDQFNGIFTGVADEDRDTTFKNVGEPYNYAPPLFCSRLDVQFMFPITDRR